MDLVSQTPGARGRGRPQFAEGRRRGSKLGRGEWGLGCGVSRAEVALLAWPCLQILVVKKNFDFVRESAVKYFRIVPVRDSTQQNKA